MSMEMSSMMGSPGDHPATPVYTIAGIKSNAMAVVREAVKELLSIGG
jgi:hypothetical protein